MGNGASSVRLERFYDALASEPNYAPFAAFLRKTFDSAGDDLFSLSERMLGWAEDFLGKDCYPTLVNGYVSFVMDVNRSQLRYERDGAYKNKSYDEVFAAVYGNEEFMKHYHWGVFVTTFAWPHHLSISDIYLNTFLSEASLTLEADAPRMVDLGSGSGVWSFLAAGRAEQLRIDAVDISETSVSLSRRMRRVVRGGERVEVHVGDALSWGLDCSDSYDLGVSCFVLEHLEAPELLLQNMARLLKPRGLGFVTLALTAAEIDHIYEFRRESEVLIMAENAGFRVERAISLAAGSYPPNGRFLPRSMALLLRKRAGEFW